MDDAQVYIWDFETPFRGPHAPKGSSNLAVVPSLKQIITGLPSDEMDIEIIVRREGREEAFFLIPWDSPLERLTLVLDEVGLAWKADDGRIWRQRSSKGDGDPKI